MDIEGLENLPQGSYVVASNHAYKSGVDGFLLHQFISPGSLDDFTELLVPELRSRGLYGGNPTTGTLRSRLRSDGADRLPADHPAAATRIARPAV
jgi:hypothetical protein